MAKTVNVIVFVSVVAVAVAVAFMAKRSWIFSDVENNIKAYKGGNIACTCSSCCFGCLKG